MPEDQIFKPSFLGMLGVSIFGGIFVLFAGLPALITLSIGGILIALIAALAIVFTYLSIKLTSYELREDGLFIRRGIIAKKQILLLYTQIQDVSEYQSFWEKIVGLKTLQIKTMTVSSALAGNLTNLTETDASTLKQLLLREVNNRSKKAHSKTSQKTHTVYDSNIEQDEKSANPYPIHFTRLIWPSLLGTIILAIIVSLVLITVGAEVMTFIGVMFWIVIIFVSTPIGYAIKQGTYKYWIGENTITIKSGWLNTQKTVVEYEKIQDFILSQSIFERILGLATIHIETGSVEIMTGDRNKQIPNYSIEAITHADARILSGKLMKKIDINYTPLAKPLVKEIPLDKKKVIKKSITGIIGLFILFGIILGITWFVTRENAASRNIFSTIATIIIILGTILAIWTIIYQNMYYNRYFYDWSRDTLPIIKGVIGRQQIFLRFEKVQNVFVYQDLLDRIFGLYNIRLSTVGNGSMYMCHIAGLSKENSDKLVPLLLKAVKANG